MIPIPGVGDAIGNIVKQTSLMVLTDHKFDWDDLAKDFATGLVMGKIGDRVSSITKGIRGTSKFLHPYHMEDSSVLLDIHHM